MKTKIIITALLSMCLIANTTAQDKKRLKIIEKSIKQSSCELYKDTVYVSGIAQFLYKIDKKTNPYKAEMLQYKDIYDLKGNLICNLNWITEELIPFQKSKNSVGWVKFNGIDGDARFTMPEGGEELVMLKYLVEKNVVTSNGVNPSEANKFMKENKATRYVGAIRKECSMDRISVKVKNKKGENVCDISFPYGALSAFAVAEGDKIYLYADNSLYAETEITSKVQMITISASCSGFIKE